MARILVAEDCRINRNTISRLLEEGGHAVDEACDGEACLKRLAKVPEGFYDLILMDVKMPVVDGLEATRELRDSSMEWLRKIPIISISADDNGKECREAGMDAHIRKPFGKEILTLIEEFL